MDWARGRRPFDGSDPGPLGPKARGLVVPRSSGRQRQLLVWCVIGLCFNAPALAARGSEEDTFEFTQKLLDDRMFELAAKGFIAFVRDYPTSRRVPLARFRAGDAYLRAGSYDAAREALEEFLVSHPDDVRGPRARFYLAQSLAHVAGPSEAAEAYLKTERLYPSSEVAPAALLGAGRALLEAGSTARARDPLERLLAAHPEAPERVEGRYLVARVYLADGDTTAAVEALEAAAGREKIESPSQRAALRLLGQLHLATGDLAGAKRTWKRFRTEAQKSEEALGLRLDIADTLEASGDWSDALHAYQEVVALGPPADLEERARFGAARAYDGLAQDSLAAAAYGDLLDRLEAGPRRARALYGWARASFALGAMDAALTAARELRKDYPKASQTSLSLWDEGRAWIALGRPQRAATALEAFIASDASSELRNRATFRLAQLYDAELEEPDQAVRLYRALIEAHTQFEAEALWALAQLQELSGALPEAARLYEQFTQRFLDHPDASEAMRSAEYIRSFVVRDLEGATQALVALLGARFAGMPPLMALFELAEVRMRHLHDFEGAIEAFATFLSRDPTADLADDAQYGLARAYEALSRKRELEGEPAERDTMLDESRQAWNILIEQYPESPWADEAAFALVEIGLAAIPADSMNDWQAISSYRAFLSSYPTSDQAPKALLRIGDRYLALADSSSTVEALTFYDRAMAEDPDSEWTAQALLGRGRALLRLGKRQEAAAAFGHLSQEYDGTPEARDGRWELARTLVALDRPTEAIAELEVLGQRGWRLGRDTPRVTLLADLYARTGQHQAEIALLEGALAEDRWADAVELRLRLVRARRDAGDSLVALREVTALLSAAREAGHYPAAALEQAILLEAMRPDAARRAYRALLRAAPRSSEAAAARERLGHLLFAAGDYNDALALYDEVLRSESEETVAARVVIAHLRLGDRKGAKAARKRFEKLAGKGSDWEGQFELERALLDARDGRYDDARDRLAVVQKRFGPLLSERAAYERARTFQREGVVPKAQEALEQFLEQYPQSPFAAEMAMALGTLYHQQDQLELAVARYEQVAALDDSVRAADALWNAMLAYEHMGRYGSAITQGRRLLEGFPSYERASRVGLKIGYDLLQRGRPAEALTQLERVLETLESDEEAEARYYLGEAYWGMRDWEQAVREYLRVAYLHRSEALWAVTAELRAAACYEKLNRKAQARRLYQRVVATQGAASPFGQEAQAQLEALGGR